MTTTTKKNRAAKKTAKPEKAEIRVRIDAKTKRRAEKLFKRHGITASDGVRMLLAQAITDDALPYIPNAESLKAIEESRSGKGQKMTVDEFHGFLDEA